MNNSLTEAVVTYQKSGKNWSELSERISLYAYQYPSRFTSWDYDRCSDFFISFMPKIPGLVKRYKPNRPFETYLYSSLKWYMKTFTEHLASQEHYDAWSMNESVQKIETLADEYPEQVGEFIPRRTKLSPDCPFEIDPEGRLANTAIRTRILAIALIYAIDIELEKIPAIAHLTDVEPAWLDKTMELARSIVMDKIEQRNALRFRRNECWYNMGKAQKRQFSDGKWDREVSKRWEKKYQYWRKRYLLACDNLRRFQIKLTQQEVGRMLNTPANTIASGLHILRKYWTEPQSSG